ncbi:Rossmann-like and DUF2520 domain-containing protein [Fulvivirga sedimenti]|uniref:DUF2520 domain-containing protein n=1 Tax=Fulvivirga sedimenti TaxID=2879465 RepID=A0A9X1HUP4_9BACT|nr:Rossmann-like and DUF2520 domain-containing protein [Fulvivirga sedimenti]MCA6078255.1 DUF2520 domain-containing protein [Fulvivirga sedimenti]
MMNLSASIVGAGNLAWHLAPALDNAGVVIREVYARKKGDAKSLADRLYQARVKTDLDFSRSSSDLIILAVSDEAIEDVAMEIELAESASIVHTSASQSAGILANAMTEKFGVFYPLQTFSKSKRVDFRDIPILIESMDANTLKLLRKIASSLSRNVVELDGKTRRAVHLSAVFASNFTNHMFKVARDITDYHQVDFKVLFPLIRETVEKMMEIGPEAAQTGPARRRDYAILDKHLELLKENEELSEIYRLISQHIVDTYTEEEE